MDRTFLYLLLLASWLMLFVVALGGCATTDVLVTRDCSVTVAQLNTGTVVECKDGEVRVERKSVGDTTDGLLKSVLGALL